MYQWCRGPRKWAMFPWCKEHHQLLVARFQDRLAVLQQDRVSLTVPPLPAQLQDTALLKPALLQQGRVSLMVAPLQARLQDTAPLKPALLQQGRVSLTLAPLPAQLQDTAPLSVAFPRLRPRSSLLSLICKVYHTPAHCHIHLPAH